MTHVNPIPNGYHTATPFLLVEGADKLIDFLKMAFNATETYRFSMSDGTIGHAEILIGDSVIMVSEAISGEYKATKSGIHLYVDDCDTTYKRALKAGATSVKEPADQPYGDRSAGVKDQFGNHWSIATHIEDLSKEEIDERMTDALTKNQSS